MVFVSAAFGGCFCSLLHYQTSTCLLSGAAKFVRLEIINVVLQGSAANVSAGSSSSLLLWAAGHQFHSGCNNSFLHQKVQLSVISSSSAACIWMRTPRPPYLPLSFTGRDYFRAVQDTLDLYIHFHAECIARSCVGVSSLDAPLPLLHHSPVSLDD